MLDRLTSIKGAQFSLGPELGRGGEGVVYGVNGHSEIAIKVYKKEQVTNERRSKLRQMVAMASPQLAKHSAWPIDVIDNGVFAVVMPRVSGIELHDLYGPKSRMVKMPKATFRFLIMSAYNLCAALHEVHQIGAVVGDFNQRNILVSEKGAVCFVDCDSFQIKSGTQLFKCTVGTPDQLAPELHGADLSRVLRSPNHDNFTLAVLIFQLLFIGRHPFAGVGGPDEISEAIRRYLFAYGKRGNLNGIRPPPHVPPPDTVPPGLFALFERAFADNSANTNRPTPIEWAQQLQTFLNSIIKCRVNPVHEYVSSRPACPWCELRVVLFLADGQQVFRIDAATINELADKLEATRPYAYNFTLPSIGVIVPAPLPDNLDRKSGAFWFGIGLALLALVGLFYGHWFLAILVGLWALNLVTNEKSKSRRAEYRQQLEQEYAAAEKKQKSIDSNLRAIHGRYVQDYETVRRRVTPLKAEYNGLPVRRQKQIGDLHQRLREIQLEQYLDRQFISGAGIPGIGPKRLATLRGYGIETAADVSWRMRASGFGADLKRKLMAWRQSCELGFRFNPNAQIDPREIQKIDAILHIRRNEIEAELHSINGHLDARTRQLRADLEIAVAELPAAAQLVAQAKVNLAAFDAPSNAASATPAHSSSQNVDKLFGLAAVVVTLVVVAVLSNQQQSNGTGATVVPQPLAPPAQETGQVLLAANVETLVTIERTDGVASAPLTVSLNATAAETPTGRQLAPGKYKLTFAAKGWQHSKVSEIEVLTGKNNSVGVNFAKTAVDFTSAPVGATVREGGVPIGVTPFRSEGITVEEHSFTFSEKGRPDGALTVNVSENPQPINFVWPTGNVTVVSTPSGAEVWHESKKVGTTPLNIPNAVVGDYLFSVISTGYETAEVRGTVTSKETLALSVALTDIRPAKARLLVTNDGKRLRITNLGERTIELHRILVSGTGDTILETILTEVRIRPKESTEVRSNIVITPQMTLSLAADPETVEVACEWEAPAPAPPTTPFLPKSIKANLNVSSGRLTIANQSSAKVRILYVLISGADSRTPRHVTVEQDVASKQSIRVELRSRIGDGDSVQIATDPSLPSGTIDFSSY